MRAESSLPEFFPLGDRHVGRSQLANTGRHETGVNRRGVPPLVLIPVVAGLESEPIYIALIYLKTVLLCLSPSGGSGFDQRSHRLVGVFESLFIGFIKVFVGETLEVFDVLHLADLAQLD